MCIFMKEIIGTRPRDRWLAPTGNLQLAQLTGQLLAKAYSLWRTLTQIRTRSWALSIGWRYRKSKIAQAAPPLLLRKVTQIVNNRVRLQAVNLSPVEIVSPIISPIISPVETSLVEIRNLTLAKLKAVMIQPLLTLTRKTMDRTQKWPRRL